MSYILLLFLAIVLFCFSTKTIGQKIHSPVALYLVGYSISILFAILGLSTWNNQTKLDAGTVGMVACAIICFVAGSTMAMLFCFKKKADKKNGSAHIYRVHPLIFAISITLYLLGILLVIHELKVVCSKYSCGASAIPDLIAFYRSKSFLFNDDGESFSFLTMQLLKMLNIMTVVYCYVFINNKKLGIAIKNNYQYIIPIILNIILGLLQSGRGAALTTIVGFIVIYLYFNSNKHNNVATIKKLIPIGAIILLLFYFGASLIGRTTDKSFLEYITFYFGCPIPSLNQIYWKKLAVFESPLENSLKGLSSFFKKAGLYEGSSRMTSLPFIMFDDFGSNVYTNAYRPYIDFGVLGIIILVTLSGFLLTILYKNAEKTDKPIGLILYALYASKIIDSCRDEMTFKLIISTGLVTNIIITIVMVKLLLTERKESHEN